MQALVLQNLFFFEGDQSAKYYPKPFTYMDSLSPRNNSMRKVLLSSLFTNEEAGVHRGYTPCSVTPLVGI